MPRKKTGPRCGRPVNPHARRRKTTRRGRKGLPEPVNTGSPQLLAKRQAVAGARNDIDVVDYPGILAANELIDTDKLTTLRMVEG